MSNFWKEHYDQNSELFGKSLCKQVGKTVNGVEIDGQQLDYIASSIIDALHIAQEDVVIDLCCGNGLITRNIAASVKKVIGVDFSEGLINTAIAESHVENIAYVASDVLQLPNNFFAQSTKIYMYEALQHFSEEMFAQLLVNINAVGNTSKIFLGSVPDKGKLWSYYNTEEKRLFYFQRQRDDRPHMGKWWEQCELRSIAEQHGFRVNIISQNPLLYTAHYRFNCLLEITGE